MKMIWPGRALGVALMVPALLSLALFVNESVWPLVLLPDAAVAILAFYDILTLTGSGRLRVESAIRVSTSPGTRHETPIVDPCARRS